MEELAEVSKAFAQQSETLERLTVEKLSQNQAMQLKLSEMDTQILNFRAIGNCSNHSGNE